MQVESSMTMTPPEPAMVPAALRASNSSETSISLAASTGAEEPPGMTPSRSGRPRCRRRSS